MFPYFNTGALDPLLGELSSSTMEATFNRGDRRGKGLGNFLIGKVVPVAEDQHHPLLIPKLFQHLPDRFLVLLYRERSFWSRCIVRFLLPREQFIKRGEVVYEA